MKLTRSFLAAALSFSFAFVSFQTFLTQSVQAQDSRIALQRGYRTGYSDGYMSGYRDAIENAARGYNRHQEYVKAERAYSKDYGAVEDYRDGYQQGFEIGYDTGFEKRSFDAALPLEIKRRGAASSKVPVITTSPESKNTTANMTTSVEENRTIENPTYASKVNDNDAKTENAAYVSNRDDIVVIPVDTELIVEILSDLSTDKNREGDMFQARVVSPSEISGAIIEGRISRIAKSGRIKRRAEMTLSFDRIRLSDTRWANYNAILTEVLPMQGDNVRRVNVEGTVEGKSSLKSDTVKVGAAAGTGLVIGAVAGGPVGAVVGAGVGTAVGVGAVVIDRGKQVKLSRNQQLRIRTVYETQIR